MITLKTLRWSNMFSYGEDNIIDFTKNTISQVVGPNGSGKTSILHILEEILFNKNSKGYRKSGIINRNIKSSFYSGTLVFNIDGTEYELSVKRAAASQKVILLKNGEDISQHTASSTYDLIEKLFKIDFKTSSQIISQNSKSSLQFLTTTDTLRKKFLIDLLNYEIYLEIYDQTKEIHKKEFDNLKILEVEQKHLLDWVKNNSGTKYVVRSLKIVPDRPKELETKIRELTQQISTIDSTCNNIRNNNQYIEMRNAIPLEALVEDTTVTSLVDLQSRVAVLKSDISALKSRQLKIQKLKGKCHECLQDIHETFTAQQLRDCESDIQLKSDELNIINKDLVFYTAKNNRARVVKKYIEDFEKYSNLIDTSLPTEEPNKGELEAELKTLRLAEHNILSEIQLVNEYNKEVTEDNAKVDLINSQRVDIQVKLDKVTNKIQGQTELVNELEILKKAFSTNGLVAYKIENSVKELEDLTNSYLEELSDGRFQLFFIINNDKLNVVIKDNGIDVEIEALSAGELSRVTTSTLLAIRKLMSTLSKSQINLLFLDETLDVLDAEGKEKLIEILLKETNLNTFLISHAYTHPLLSKVIVTKERNISKVEQL